MDIITGLDTLAQVTKFLDDTVFPDPDINATHLWVLGRLGKCQVIPDVLFSPGQSYWLRDQSPNDDRILWRGLDRGSEQASLCNAGSSRVAWLLSPDTVDASRVKATYRSGAGAK